MSHQQRCFVQMHHCFLLRNVDKVFLPHVFNNFLIFKINKENDFNKNIFQVKRNKNNSKWNWKQSNNEVQSFSRQLPEIKQSDVFYTQLNALSTLRSIKTRRLAQAEDNPELTKVAKLAYIFKDLYSAVISAKGEFNFIKQ